ncbi:hypothetical protein DH2020_005510 [Rehmannia glutinosa]|uniref:KIB1-4 beta-propeller domain-containing protein n=1 Tax=Rehmannia glutinosa TaxID=99300 RepID=A0ABR0XGB9_REHGL
MSSPNRSPNLETYPDWRDLPTVLLAAIAKRFTSIHEYLPFRGVCSSWRSAATFDNFDRALPRAPWLMYVTEEKAKNGDEIGEEEENKGDAIGEEEEKKGDGIEGDVKRVANFLDMSNNKTYKIIDFASADGKLYLSWGGWILCVSEEIGAVNLTHPVWRTVIDLPGLDTFPEYIQENDDPLDTLHEYTHENDENGSRYISKMVLSGSPTIKCDLVVMVIWGKKHQLGFSRPGDPSWSVMDTWDGSFSDILYHNGKLYAVDSTRRVVECDIHGPNPSQIQQVFSLPNVDDRFASFDKICYLVESFGKFLIARRHFAYRNTLSFDIVEIDLKDGSHKEIRHLWNKSLFLGFNASLCLHLSAWNVVKLKPNCIYFTDHFGQCVDSDMGVFCVQNMRMRGLPGGFSCSSLTPPIWVVPSF